MEETLFSAAHLQAEKNLIEHLYSTYEQQMYAIAYNILHKKADAEDAVQHTFLSILDNPGRIMSLPDKEKGYYLTVVVKNVALNMCKKQKREEDIADIEQLGELDSGVKLEELVFSRIMLEKVKAALRRLPDVYYEIIYLNAVIGMNTRELADTLGTSEILIRQRLFRARRRLTEILEKEHAFDE